MICMLFRYEMQQIITPQNCNYIYLDAFEGIMVSFCKCNNSKYNELFAG